MCFLVLDFSVLLFGFLTAPSRTLLSVGLIDFLTALLGERFADTGLLIEVAGNLLVELLQRGATIGRELGDLEGPELAPPGRPASVFSIRSNSHLIPSPSRARTSFS